MVNDVTIIAGIISVFILIGTFIPIVNDTFNVTQGDSDVEKLTGSLINSTVQIGEKSGFEAVVGSLGFFDIVKSILLMFFWTFGALPVWLDLIFLIFRIIFLILFVRLIRSGGG